MADFTLITGDRYLYLYISTSLHCSDKWNTADVHRTDEMRLASRS